MRVRLSRLPKIIVAIIMIFFIVGVHNVVYANDTLNEIESNVEKFNNEGEKNSINISEITKKFSDLGQVLTLVGTGIYVAIIAYMGIKYMTANSESRAKLKMQLIGILVSGIVLFGAYHIWCMVIDILK